MGTDGRRRARGDERQHLPLRRVSGNRCRGAGGSSGAGDEWRREQAMIDFEYLRVTDLASAVRAGAAPSTRFVAGGTNLIDLMKLDVERPTHVVDINDLARRDPSLAAIAELPDGGLRIGGLARMRDVAWDARVRERY